MTAEKNAVFEQEEVRRAFEKFGVARLLVAADGGVSPHIGVLRLLTWLSESGHLTDLQLALAEQDYKKEKER